MRLSQCISRFQQSVLNIVQFSVEEFLGCDVSISDCSSDLSKPVLNSRDFRLLVATVIVEVLPPLFATLMCIPKSEGYT